MNVDDIKLSFLVLVCSWVQYPLFVEIGGETGRQADIE